MRFQVVLNFSAEKKKLNFIFARRWLDLPLILLITFSVIYKLFFLWHSLETKNLPSTRAIQMMVYIGKFWILTNHIFEFVQYFSNIGRLQSLTFYFVWPGSASPGPRSSYRSEEWSASLETDDCQQRGGEDPGCRQIQAECGWEGHSSRHVQPELHLHWEASVPDGSSRLWEWWRRGNWFRVSSLV